MSLPYDVTKQPDSPPVAGNHRFSAEERDVVARCGVLGLRGVMSVCRLLDSLAEDIEARAQEKRLQSLRMFKDLVSCVKANDDNSNVAEILYDKLVASSDSPTRLLLGEDSQAAAESAAFRIIQEPDVLATADEAYELELELEALDAGGGGETDSSLADVGAGDPRVLLSSTTAHTTGVIDNNIATAAPASDRKRSRTTFDASKVCAATPHCRASFAPRGSMRLSQREFRPVKMTPRLASCAEKFDASYSGVALMGGSRPPHPLTSAFGTGVAVSNRPPLGISLDRVTFGTSSLLPSPCQMITAGDGGGLAGGGGHGVASGGGGGFDIGVAASRLSALEQTPFGVRSAAAAAIKKAITDKPRTTPRTEPIGNPSVAASKVQDGKDKQMATRNDTTQTTIENSVEIQQMADTLDVKTTGPVQPLAGDPQDEGDEERDETMSDDAADDDLEAEYDGKRDSLKIPGGEDEEDAAEKPIFIGGVGIRIIERDQNHRRQTSVAGQQLSRNHNRPTGKSPDDTSEDEEEVTDNDVPPDGPRSSIEGDDEEKEEDMEAEGSELESAISPECPRTAPPVCGIHRNQEDDEAGEAVDETMLENSASGETEAVHGEIEVDSNHSQCERELPSSGIESKTSQLLASLTQPAAMGSNSTGPIVQLDEDSEEDEEDQPDGLSSSNSPSSGSEEQDVADEVEQEVFTAHPAIDAEDNDDVQSSESDAMSDTVDDETLLLIPMLRADIGKQKGVTVPSCNDGGVSGVGEDVLVGTTSTSTSSCQQQPGILGNDPLGYKPALLVGANGTSFLNSETPRDVTPAHSGLLAASSQGDSNPQTSQKPSSGVAENSSAVQAPPRPPGGVLSSASSGMRIFTPMARIQEKLREKMSKMTQRFGGGPTPTQLPTVLNHNNAEESRIDPTGSCSGFQSRIPTPRFSLANKARDRQAFQDPADPCSAQIVDEDEMEEENVDPCTRQSQQSTEALLPAQPKLKRYHRYLRPLPPRRNPGDSINLQRDGPHASATWARGKDWHQEVLNQTKWNPYSLFGCGIRVVAFNDVFQTPDFRRVKVEGNKTSCIRRWETDRANCGFGPADGITLSELTQMVEQLGKSVDISNEAYQSEWIPCDENCHHDVGREQPWFREEQLDS